MADGVIRSINQSSFPDLYYALRGGGNNFGIVTRFDMDTYEQGLMWGGLRVYPFEAQQNITHGFQNFTKNPDPDMALITSFSAAGGFLTASVIWDYSQPVADPPIVQSMKGLDAFTLYEDTTRITSLVNLTDELNETTPPGYRNRYTTGTYKNNATLQNMIVDHFVTVFNNVEPKISNTTGLAPVVAFQPITKDISAQFAKNGGNALGVSPADGGLMRMWCPPFCSFMC